MKRICRGLSELNTIADKYLQYISNEERTTACVVGLSGELGSGKTTFTKEVAKLVGVTETVTSPTFVIQKKYLLKEGLPFRKFIHIDAYRLESGYELEVLNWEELIKDKTNLIFIEWPEQVVKVLPKNIKKISFTVIDETTRKIEW